MKLPKLNPILPRILELLYSVLLLAWFFLPFAMAAKGSLVPLSLASQVGLTGALAALLTVGALLIPVLALWKIASFFLEGMLPGLLKGNGVVSLLLGFLASAGLILSHVIHVFTFASSSAYFSGVGPFAWAAIATSVIYNAIVLIRLIGLVGSGGKEAKELVAFQIEREASPDVRRYAGIQRRLLISFLSLIVVVIVVICAVLLNDFSKTILTSVIANGESIVDRTANMAKSNSGERDNIARDDYLRDELKKNYNATFPFNSLTYYPLDKKTAPVVDKKSSTRDMAKAIFAAGESTLKYRLDEKTAPVLDPKTGSRDMSKAIFAPVALNIPAIPASSVDIKQTGWRVSPDGARIEFTSPVILAGQTLGLVVADYDQAVIYEPYFRTQTKVFVFAGLFIYLSIFLTYFLGRAIVMPLLFLNMSVNRISTTLSGMIGGKIKISAELLKFEDRVTTKDEIKGLSIEIGDMTTVIRGVVPYISASTLKYADKGTTTSESRDLTFLFTDIRGFTTLCEGRSPDEVVRLLNHFLELQSNLILKNEGDIDKFVGDEIMAMFEGPEKELNACRAGMAIRTAMAHEKEMAEQNKQHVVSIGIGINTGPVTFGSVGAHNRMDFTSIGDTVNLAARLEGANKELGTKTLITEAVYEKVKKEFLCREIDLLTVKGKSKPARVYEVLQARAHAKPRLDPLAEAFEAGLMAYRRRDWVTATERFKSLYTEYKDTASEVFLKRIAAFKRNPPDEDWDGVFAMKVK